MRTRSRGCEIRRGDGWRTRPAGSSSTPRGRTFASALASLASAPAPRISTRIQTCDHNHVFASMSAAASGRTVKVTSNGLEFDPSPQPRGSRACRRGPLPRSACRAPLAAHPSTEHPRPPSCPRSARANRAVRRQRGSWRRSSSWSRGKFWRCCQPSSTPTRVRPFGARLTLRPSRRPRLSRELVGSPPASEAAAPYSGREGPTTRRRRRSRSLLPRGAGRPSGRERPRP